MARTKKLAVGVVGLGYVGGTIKHWLEKNRYRFTPYFYDKYKNIGSVKEVNKADVIFVAVPTPFNETSGGYDDSAVREVVKKIEDGKIIIIKSTVLPGRTDAFQKTYPRKIFLFNPEFLRGMRSGTFLEDFIKPDRQIVGYTNSASRRVAPKIFKILPRAPFMKIIKAREAEMVKYFGNTFLATRVIFANQIYDLCDKLGGINYEAVKKCVAEDARIGGSHFDIFTDGYRGFGGPCLPKDLKALLQFARANGLSLPLLQAVHGVNNKLIRGKKPRTRASSVRGKQET